MGFIGRTASCHTYPPVNNYFLVVLVAYKIVGSCPDKAEPKRASFDVTSSTVHKLARFPGTSFASRNLRIAKPRPHDIIDTDI